MIATLRWACVALAALFATPGGALGASIPTEAVRPARVVIERTVHAADGVVALELGPESGPIETIEATREHPFWARSSASALTASSTSRPGSGPRDGWVPAGELRPGDEIFTSTGGWIRVHGNTWISREQLVYNLDVEGADTFFVGQSGAWVHNACWSPGKVGSGPRNAFNHWLKHGADFPEYQNATDYVRGAHDFFRNRGNFATRTRPNGQVVVFDSASERFGVFAADGTPSSYYVPNPAQHGWASNLDYFLFSH
ncbi:MAG: hypothetical protein K1X94_24060 [Sandaracinaceae bacterium]|nr:hypothetical protein [Sandaracinaceae bacterium]